MEANPVLPKKKQDPVKFEASRAEVADLVEKAENGEILLVYVDESGVATTPPNRYGWARENEVHTVIAQSGARINVMGAMLSNGELFATHHKGPTTAPTFATFMENLQKKVGVPFTVILDNASFHKAKAIQPRIEALKDAGVTFVFLSPYSPELNRIEILWRKIKYEWMEFVDRTSSAVEEAIDKIIAGFGKEYKLAFSSSAMVRELA